MEGPHVDEGLVGGNHSKASSRSRRRLERERRRNSSTSKKGIVLDMILMRECVLYPQAISS